MQRIRDDIAHMRQREVKLEPPNRETLGVGQMTSYDFMNSIPKVGDHTKASLYYVWQKIKCHGQLHEWCKEAYKNALSHVLKDSYFTSFERSRHLPLESILAVLTLRCDTIPSLSQYFKTTRRYHTITKQKN